MDDTTSIQSEPQVDPAATSEPVLSKGDAAQDVCGGSPQQEKDVSEDAQSSNSKPEQDHDTSCCSGRPVDNAVERAKDSVPKESPNLKDDTSQGVQKRTPLHEQDRLEGVQKTANEHEQHGDNGDDSAEDSDDFCLANYAGPLIISCTVKSPAQYDTTTDDEKVLGQDTENNSFENGNNMSGQGAAAKKDQEESEPTLRDVLALPTSLKHSKNLLDEAARPAAESPLGEKPDKAKTGTESAGKRKRSSIEAFQVEIPKRAKRVRKKTDARMSFDSLVNMVLSSHSNEELQQLRTECKRRRWQVVVAEHERRRADSKVQAYRQWLEKRSHAREKKRHRKELKQQLKEAKLSTLREHSHTSSDEEYLSSLIDADSDAEAATIKKKKKKDKAPSAMMSKEIKGHVAQETSRDFGKFKSKQFIESDSDSDRSEVETPLGVSSAKAPDTKSTDSTKPTVAEGKSKGRGADSTPGDGFSSRPRLFTDSSSSNSDLEVETVELVRKPKKRPKEKPLKWTSQKPEKSSDAKGHKVKTEAKADDNLADSSKSVSKIAGENDTAAISAGTKTPKRKDGEKQKKKHKKHDKAPSPKESLGRSEESVKTKQAVKQSPPNVHPVSPARKIKREEPDPMSKADHVLNLLRKKQLPSVGEKGAKVKMDQPATMSGDAPAAHAKKTFKIPKLASGSKVTEAVIAGKVKAERKLLASSFPLDMIPTEKLEDLLAKKRKEKQANATASPAGKNEPPRAESAQTLKQRVNQLLGATPPVSQCTPSTAATKPSASRPKPLTELRRPKKRYEDDLATLRQQGEVVMDYRTLRALEALRQHYEHQWRCSHCSFQAKTHYELQHDHMPTHATDALNASQLSASQLKCTECPFVADNIERLVRHIQYHIVEQEFQCEHCSYSHTDPDYIALEHVPLHFGSLAPKTLQRRRSIARGIRVTPGTWTFRPSLEELTR